MHSGFPGFTDVTELGSDGPVLLLRARDAESGRPVGLELITVPDAQRANLERDLDTLRPLSGHPNLIGVERILPSPDGRLALVVEPTRGSLADRLRSGPLPVTEAAAVTIRLAGALETMHRAGLAHGDVVAANIRMTERGEPALAGFGLATLRRQPPARTAPERLDGGASTAAADVYQLAAATFEMVTGRPPFASGDGETFEAVAARVRTEPAPTLPPNLAPPDLSDALARALAKDPAARPTAAQFAATLNEVQAAHGWSRTSAVIEGEPRPATPLAKPTEDEWSAPTMTSHATDADSQALPEPPPPAAATVVRRGRHAAADDDPGDHDPGDDGPVGEVPIGAVPIGAVPVPPPPAEQTVRRSALPSVPPAAEQTVRRSALPQPPAAGQPAAEQTVRRSALPVPPPSGDETVRRSDLPAHLPTAPPSVPSSVPTWATRTAGEPDPMNGAPGSGIDLTLDPMSLSQRVTLRSGASSLVVDDRRILMRSWLRRRELPWSEIQGFEPRFEGVGASGSGGHLVAVTRSGPVELPATKRSLADLRYVHALLEAYRRRAQLTGPPQ